jgi:hypothetical protein
MTDSSRSFGKMIQPLPHFTFWDWVDLFVPKWIDELMDAHTCELGSEELWQWYEARYRYPTKEQWEAQNPSPGQVYQPFSMPRPKR